MTKEFKLPEISEGVETADVAEIHVAEGDTVSADQIVMEIETEKAVVELPCPIAGRVAKLHVKAGDSVKIGATLLTIEESGSAPAKAAPAAKKEEPAPAPKAAEKPAPEKPAPAPAPKAPEPVAAKESAPAPAKPAPAPAAKSDGDAPPPPAGPATRRLARELGIDLTLVTGTGPGNRITSEDVQGYVKQLAAAAASGGGGGTGPARSPALPDLSKYGPVRRERMSKLGRTAANNLTTAWQVIPHVTQHDLTDVTEAEAARRQYMEKSGKGGPKVTFTSIAVKAAAAALKEFPNFGASIDMEAGELVYREYCHIGVAVDTEHGLVVPVIRDADKKNVRQIAEELEHLSAKARDRKLLPDEMTGGVFTITNLGGIGGTAFTPIVNWPEVAILGMSRSRTELKLVDGKPTERLMLPLSLSYDHRVINGADAARFVVWLSKVLSDPFQMLIQL